MYIPLFLVSLYILVLLSFSLFQDKINTLIGFGLHKRAFSSYGLSLTIIATMVGGTGFANKINYFYSDGWIYLLITLGMPLQTLILSKVLIPKCSKVLGSISIGSFMAEAYGEKVRVISAVLGSIGVCGFIGSQIKIMAVSGSLLFPQFDNMFISIVAAALIVCIYTYHGGIRSVILTDMVQCCCFFISFFVFIYYLYPSVEQEQYVMSHYNTEVFHLNTALKRMSTQDWLNALTMFLYFFIPSFVPTQFQRIAIARNQKQLTESWWAATFVLFVATILPCVISYFLFIKDPTLARGEVYKYLLTLIENPFLKAILIIGILSMGMSTADSHLNIAAVNLANDTYKKDQLSPLQKFDYARRYVILICICSVLLIFIKGDFLKIVLFASSFYMPLITVPLMALVMGYRTTERCLLLGMSITAIILIMWHVLKELLIITLEPVIILTFFNGILLLSLHYTIEKWEWFKRFGITSKLHEIKKTA